MKISVGDYVRFYDRDWTEIGKIVGEVEDSHLKVVKCKDGYYDLGNFIKSSPNIIDLIEENDLIKIEERKGIYTICEVEKFKEPYTNYEFLGVRLENQPIARKLYELNIKSIVTKEQFESMEYKL